MSHIASGYAKSLTSAPSGERLNQREKLLMMILADSHNTDRGCAWPSVATLAHECLMDERLTRRTIASLESKMILERVHPEKQGRGNITEYRFLGLERKEGNSTPLPKAPEGGSKGGYKGGLEGGSKGGLQDTRNKEELEQEPEQELDSFSLRSKEGVEVKPSTKVKKETKSKADPEVEAVYECYPRKEARGAALKAIEGAVGRLVAGTDGRPAMSRDDSLMFLARRVGLYARSPAGNNGRFTPHPATWFNQGRYLDDEGSWKRDDRQQQTFDERRQQQTRENIVAGLGYGNREVSGHSGFVVEDDAERGGGRLLEGTTRGFPAGKG